MRHLMAPHEQAWVLAKSRADLGDLLLIDAQRTSNSVDTRYSCAFDALYLFALAVLDTPAGLQSHPDRQLLLEGAQRLKLNLQALDPVIERMNRAYGPLEAPEDEVSALIALAMDARQSLGLSTDLPRRT